jgi:hypothetical protein
MTHPSFLQNAPLRLAALSLLAALSGCSSDGDSPSNPPQVGTLEGTFLVGFKPAASGSTAYTSFLGVVFDGPSPPNPVLKVDSEANGCQLLVPPSLFCSPSCGAAGICTAENVCTPYPTAQNLGVVHVTGLGSSEFTIEPMAPAFNYQPVVTLPFPSCEEGNSVKVTTDQFAVEGKCIAPLDLMGPDPIPVASGKGVALTWAPPGKSGISRVKIKLDVAHHGGKKGEIVCDIADTGSFEIPASLVTKLVSLGLAGFPTIVVDRVSTASADKQSGVKLVVSSSTERPVDTGVISCSSDDKQCPAGQTCQADLSCK